MAPVPAVRDTKESNPKGPKVIKLVSIIHYQEILHNSDSGPKKKKNSTHDC